MCVCVCAEKTTLEARCSIIYKCFVILMLTWTEYDINAPICMLSGLRVRITDDGMGRYTLLLRFPFFIILKLKMAVFMEKSFRSHTYHTHSSFRSKTLTQKTKRKTSAK